MLLHEELGAAEFTRRVKIYATDLDEAALNAARHASYLPRDPGPSLHTRLLDAVVDSSPSAISRSTTMIFWFSPAPVHDGCWKWETATSAGRSRISLFRIDRYRRALGGRPLRCRVRVAPLVTTTAAIRVP
jgi:hypothetical protein